MGDVPTDAPEHCPGTQSEQAGKESACQGCPNQNICSSGATRNDSGKDVALVQSRLSTVKHKILVLSGKGGVGKTTVASLLARGLALNPHHNVGLLDIDICGPSVPRAMGVLDEQVHQSGSGWSPVYLDDNLCVMSIGFLLPSPDDAIIWRGPKKNGMVRQFLSDVDWGDTNFLIVDTPPGTSDEHLSAATYLAKAGLTGAVVVTTPQEVALLDVRKELDFCRKTGIPVVGVVENMAGFICPKCKIESQIFPPNTGGAAKMCTEMGVRFLGSLPLDPRLTQSCDAGGNLLVDNQDSPVVPVIKKLVQGILEFCGEETEGV